ncbi:hypothetical protein Klosneuvirus_1_147 [Klosneuvirus KNV1]|uniref:Uncharacterized protein n=1 Tax=Klosneuvirus KNV1 TaxID=1977640 RepID=A0A1V0SHU0_9VIRU|nr:hypothetical protein Klosneuvirus_1_147 [Klosneuvirus KNV1]
MKFFDWTNILPPSSIELDVLQDEYILIAKTQKFYKENASIIELYSHENKSRFPKQWHNYVSLVCEQDVFLTDQICKAMYPNKTFSIVKYQDPNKEYWYHYTVKDDDDIIYDLQLHYMSERKEWLEKMVPVKIYKTRQDKLKLMDFHGFPWEGNHRTIYL